MLAIIPTHVWLGSGNRTGFQVLFDHSGDVEVCQMDVTWEEGDTNGQKNKHSACQILDCTFFGDLP